MTNKLTNNGTWLDRLQFSIGNSLRSMSDRRFIALLFVYHILVVFQGLDFNDEGFHLSVYQQFYDNPESVQYGFWMWLTAAVAGAFMKLFYFLGAWGIRLAGAIVTTLTLWIAYRALKPYLNLAVLRAAMILLTLFVNEDAKNLYYNNFSALFYFMAAVTLFKGIKENHKVWLFVAGLIVGFNIFNRIPNILGAGLGLAIIYAGWQQARKLGFIAKQIGFFAAGIVAGIGSILLLMVGLGHLPFYIESLEKVFSASKSADVRDGLEGAYGTMRILLRNVEDYFRSVRATSLVIILVLAIGWANWVLGKNWFNLQKWLNWALGLLAILLLAALGMGWFTPYRLLMLFTGTSLFGLLVLCSNKFSLELRLLALLGGLILLIHPYGSSEGIGTVVVYSLWLSFPITLHWIKNITTIHLNFSVQQTATTFSLQSIMGTSQVRKIINYILFLLAAASLYNVIRYPYLCDRHSRLEMLHTSSSPLLKGIFTSKGRADAIDELLRESGKYIKPQDVVFAFDCMPMYHFVSETRPFTGNPCIWFYTTSAFQEELLKAEEKADQLPVVVQQLIKTTGEGSAWPEVKPEQDYSKFERNLKKNEIFYEYLSRNKYKQVWNNGLFVIWLPGETETQHSINNTQMTAP